MTSAKAMEKLARFRNFKRIRELNDGEPGYAIEANEGERRVVIARFAYADMAEMFVHLLNKTFPPKSEWIPPCTCGEGYDPNCARYNHMESKSEGEDGE